MRARSSGRSPRRWLALSLLLLLLPLAGTHAPVATASSAALAPEWMAVALLVLVNEERATAGLPGLDAAGDVTAVAAERALEMATHRYFSHLNAAGVGAQVLLDERGVPCALLGENIARGTYPADQIVGVAHAAWMASADHRDNVLDPRFSRVGIGVAVVDRYWFYFAVVFLD